MTFTTPLPPEQSVSLYIHFPWCVRKCPYCDFNSHALAKTATHSEKLDPTLQHSYVDRLLADFKTDYARVKNRTLVSIFMGGGTPSLFSGKEIARLLEALNRLMSFPRTLEITLEANPGTLEAQRFAEYRAAGINRLSLGIQSFDDHKLKALGRIHDSTQAKQAIRRAQGAGFSNFNLDLMFALPEQSQAQALEDLNTALQFDPPHVSWYQLTLEPRTLFYKQPPLLPSDDQSFAMQEAGISILEQHGLQRYEISAFSQPGQACQHNRHYWEFGDYLGLGAGAHSKLTEVKTNTLQRFAKSKHPQHYLKHPELKKQQETIAGRSKLFEFMLNALRLCEPIHDELCFARTGFHFSDCRDVLDKAATQGLLHWTPQQLTLTDLGRRFVNEILGAFES